MPNCIVGLDIGSNSIKAAMCIENENKDFEILDYIYVDSKGITKGRISNVEEAINSITECLEKLKSITNKDFKDIYLGISSQECRVMSSKGHTYVDGANSNVTKQHIENAYLDAKEVVLGEGEEIIDCIINYFETDNWDYKNVKNPLELQCSVLTINVDLIICNKNTVNFFKKIIASAGYNLKGLSLSVDCLKNIFLSEKTENFNVAIVDIGAEKTDIAIYEGNRLKNVGFVPLGGNNITKDLAICLSIENELAEEIKQSYAHKFSTPSNGTIDINECTFDILLVHDIIEARLLEIIEYFNDKFSDNDQIDNIEKVIITGDGIAYYENIEYIIKEKIGKNVKVFTKNHFSFEKSSIITPISIVKEMHDRLKLIYDQQILWNKKVIIDDNSNKSKNVKKRGFSRVKAFLDEIF